ncbi:Uncharacterised protein [Mycobacteroides abscessus subsp. abscessus]|nr:Uncharacterised protein [Mycobacteroides abscessus subsp. abscessus]
MYSTSPSWPTTWMAVAFGCGTVTPSSTTSVGKSRRWSSGHAAPSSEGPSRNPAIMITTSCRKNSVEIANGEGMRDSRT